MEKLEKYDDELYISAYGLPKVGDSTKIWNNIKNNQEILKEAVKVKRNKWDTANIVKGLSICDFILNDYKSIDFSIYSELINNIYNDPNIARIVLNGFSNGGCSFLLMSLWNSNLVLDKKQKDFAVKEAMRKPGTIYSKLKEEEFLEALNKIKITEDKKAIAIYVNDMMHRLTDDQAHGIEPFDIRYFILKNSNWSIEEKQKLIMDFWCDDEEYSETLEEWESNILNDGANYREDTIPFMEKEELYLYSYEELLNFYNDKETTDRIYQEIQFCREMHQLRETKYDFEFKKKVLK